MRATYKDNYIKIEARIVISSIEFMTALIPYYAYRLGT